MAALELRADDLVDVEEAVLLEADLDERGLHPGQDVVDLAEVDVARDRPALRPLEVDLGDLVVLEHGDALLADVDGDDQLALRRRQRRAARRLAPAAVARSRRGGAPAAARRPCALPACARAAGLRRRRSAVAPLGRAGGAGLLAALAAAAPRRRFGLWDRLSRPRLSAAGRSGLSGRAVPRPGRRQAELPRRRLHSSVVGTRARKSSLIGEARSALDGARARGCQRKRSA